jgi:3-phenylpropionate/trans-cinnamate dioxygenase ferredoxin reductase subunit
VPWAWSDQYDLNLQVLGLPLDGDETVMRGSPEARSFVAFHLRDGRLVGATLVNQGREMRPCKSLIESGATLDPSRLRDPAVSLRTLAASPATAPAGALP